VPDVDIRVSGEQLALEARRADDVRGSKQYLAVRKCPRTYRYELQRLERDTE
jgi:hypothetical protein